MRLLLTLIALAGLTASGAAQNVTVTELKLSPDGNNLAFIIDDGQKNEMLLYNFEKDATTRVTDSEGTAQPLTLKSSINWVDNSTIIFLSNHSGLFQQYMIDLSRMEMQRWGSSTKSEYYLIYDPIRARTFYLQNVFDDEIGVFSRQLAASSHSRLDMNGRHSYTHLRISATGKYLYAQKEPKMSTVLFLADTGQQVKDRFPEENVIVLAWSPDDKKLLYSHAEFTGVDTAVEYLLLYDVEGRKSVQISRDENEYLTGALWAPHSDKCIYVKGNIAYMLDDSMKLQRTFDIEGTPVAWFPDGNRTLFVADGEIFIYMLDSEKMQRIY